MKTSIKNRKKQLLALCLSVLMASSFTAFAACNDDSTDSSSSSSPSTSTEKDESLVLNGDFETFNTNDGKNVIGTSATGWTRSVNSTTSGSALASKSASGIIDTADENWKQLTTSNADVSKLTEKQAKAQWDTLTTKDKLDYYEIWKDANEDGTISKDLDFYESFNVDSEDLPTCENPGTHDGDTEDTNVLMVHNQYPETDSTATYKSLGTAQKYTSSSTVTVKSGTAVEFSVWVKTSDLKASSTSGDPQDVVGKGAYISVTHSVGGKTLDAYQVKNINTADVTDNNGWMQYSFYLKGSSYADTTFTIVLGLGQGGGTDRLEYVNGYAFFDDIECEVITNDEFDAKTEGLKTVGFEETKEDKTVDASVSSDTKFAMDFYSEFSAVDFLSSVTDIKATTETSNKKVYTAANGVNGAEVYTGLGFDTTNDKTQVFANAEAMNGTGNKYLQSAYDKYFKDVKFLSGEKLLMLLSADGAAYTANSSMSFTVQPDEYLALSFYVKTSDMNGFTGAGVTLNDGNTKISIASIDTTTIAAVEIGENEDVYEGWQQCLFFVENTTDSDKSFNLTFNFGSTTVVGTTASQYYAGFAAFAGFEAREMSKIEYEGATSGTYSKIVSLAGDNNEAAGDSGFDSVASVPSNAIETGFANPKNYKGVYSNSAYVSDGEDTSANTNKNAGLLNKEYADAYGEILGKLGAASWTEAFGTATQPLVIYNDEDQANGYGFIGKSTMLSASTYSTISLRVKVSAGAVANVYLIDMDDDTHASKLSIGSNVTYWYDDDGNVCTEDPSDEHFNSKKDVAFKLQSNGLYKVNTAWEGAASVDANAYFANLANYEEDENGNLIVAEGGVSYNYNDKWDNEGQDGIAFYAKDGKYYANPSYKPEDEVFDFATAGLTPRYEAEENKDLCFTVSETNGEWATVTFYVHTGDTAKNYRLEVWSGARDGAGNKAGSYVIFDANSPTNVDATSFAELVAERKDEVSEDDYFEGVFSFFDSAKYLRYNELIDENGVGYSYESYLSSAQTSGVAYLKYADSNIYEIYADYALSEVTVTADVDDETTEEEEEDHDHEGEMNPWLLASSIAVAAALLVAIVCVVARKIMQAVRKKKGIQAHSAAKEKKEKKSK